LQYVLWGKVGIGFSTLKLDEIESLIGEKLRRACGDHGSFLNTGKT